MNRTPLWPTLLKSLAFVVVTVLASALLLATISQTGGGDRTLRAEFTDATRLQAGDDVRMAGVRIGTAALAARGFDADDFREAADVVARALRPQVGDAEIDALAERVAALAARHPLETETPA